MNSHDYAPKPNPWVEDEAQGHKGLLLALEEREKMIDKMAEQGIDPDLAEALARLYDDINKLKKEHGIDPTITPLSSIIKCNR